ncbi:hypothetical protein [Desulfonema magnum]|uniref:Uncharacterized protein n=1 Tax=Desulfonema magnum TaxID=45655 RepID=A0A975GMU6_9BACT|nr:hypothetical protein [Desulfonema magnum]QTA86188.1 Uncharacterized protein dnm_022090 [Desulfonema magnum]
MIAFWGSERAIWEKKRMAELFSFVRKQNPITPVFMMKSET